MQQEQRSPVAIAQVMQRERHAVVVSGVTVGHAGGPISDVIISTNRSGCSMWAKCPMPSSISSRPPWREERLDVVRQGAPAHVLLFADEHAEERHRQARQAHQRPLRAPRAEAAHAHRRIELPPPAVVGLRRADADEVPQPVVRQARVHPTPPPGELVERSRLAASGRRRPAVVEPAGQLAGQHLGAIVLGEVGDRPAVRDAVDVHERGEAERVGVGELRHQRPALRVPDHWDRPRAGDVVEHGDGIAEVGVPRVQLGVLAVAMPAVIPAHDPPPEGRELGGEHVERAGEVEATVHQHQRGRARVAPFVDGDANPVGVDVVAAIGCDRAGERHLLGHGGEVMAVAAA